MYQKTKHQEFNAPLDVEAVVTIVREEATDMTLGFPVQLLINFDSYSFTFSRAQV